MYKAFWHLFIEYGRFRLPSVIVVLSLVTALLEGINVGLLIPLVETLQGSQEQGGHWISRIIAKSFEFMGVPLELGTLLIALSAIMLLVAGLKYLRLILVTKLIVSFTVWLRKRRMGSILQADMAFFHGQRIGVLNDTLTLQIGPISSSLSNSIEFVVTSGLVLAYLVAALVIAPVLTAVALGLLLVTSLSVQFLIRRSAGFGASLVPQENQLQVSSLETLGGIHVVKSFLMERMRLTHFAQQAEIIGKTHYKLGENRAQLTIFQDIATFAMIGIIVYVGFSTFRLDSAVIVTLLFTLYRLAPRIAGLNTLRQSMASTMASVRVAEDILQDTYTPQIVSGDRSFDGLKWSVELKNIHFSYNSSAEVLRDTSFTIEQGKMTAIVGTSGAGKSTLMDLILRYYDPDKGQLLVDGVDLRDLNLDSWRKSIGVVNQDTYLFNDTVGNNISLGRPETTKERIIGAATQAYAHEFIQNLPEGYDTFIGDRGWNLSGGQRQRIALARAIFTRPNMVMLDEATSSLDSESEQLIQESMQELRGTCTMVVVAHRISTIRDADKIVVVQDGKVVEEGNWESLLLEDGVFANYLHLQAVT